MPVHQMSAKKSISHSISGSNQAHGLETMKPDLLRRDVNNVRYWETDLIFIHREVPCAQYCKRSECFFKLASQENQSFSKLFPSTLGRPHFYFVKISLHKDDVGTVQGAQFLCSQLVNELVISCRTRPCHAPDNANCLHSGLPQSALSNRKDKTR